MATTVTLNQTTSKNPDVVTGGDFGVILGNKPNSTVGFYGVEGTTQAALAVTLADVIAILKNTGLCASA